MYNAVSSSRSREEEASVASSSGVYCEDAEEERQPGCPMEQPRLQETECELPGGRVHAAQGHGAASSLPAGACGSHTQRPLLLWLRPFSLFLLLLSPFSPRLFPTVLFSPYVNTEWSQREAQAACGTRHLRLATPQAQGQTLDWLPMGGLLRVAVSHCQAPAGPLGANRQVTWRSPSEES